jgi:hypothetical protein
MFQILKFTEALLSTVTNRVEKHGDDDKPAVSLGLEITTGNQILDLIDPKLRPTLYKRQDEQPDLEGVELVLPVLQCNSIDRVLLPTKHEGWTLSVDDGIDDTKRAYLTVFNSTPLERERPTFCSEKVLKSKMMRSRKSLRK